MKQAWVMVLGLVLCAVAVAQGVVWPRETALVRAIDSDPGRVLEWMAENLTAAQRGAFVEWMVPVDDAQRAVELERARVLVETYAEPEAAAEVKRTLDAELVRLRPVEDDTPTGEIKQP